MTTEPPFDRVPMSRAVGWLLVSGAILFWIGAVTPPYRQWMGVPLDEYLRIVGTHRVHWYVMHGFFAAGTLVTLAGMSGLHVVLSVARTQLWSGMGLTLWLAAAVLWLVSLAHRLTMTLWAAQSVTQTGAIPAGYAATHSWMSVVFGAHMAISYVALAAFGAALQRASGLPRWVGLSVLAFGLLGVPGLATPLFQPPLMLFVAPFVAGIAILRIPNADDESHRARSSTSTIA